MSSTTVYRQNKNYVRFKHAYTDQDGAVISLATASAVVLLMTSPSGAKTSTAGVIESPTSGGVVHCDFTGINATGFWKWQFEATLPAAEPLYSPVFSYNVSANND